MTREEFNRAVLAKPSITCAEAKAIMAATSDPVLYAVCNAVVSLTAANETLIEVLEAETQASHMQRKGAVSAHDVEECVARKVAL